MEELDIPQGGQRAGLASTSYRVKRKPGMDVGTKRLVAISSGLGAVLVMIVGFWSVGGQQGGPTPVVQADKAPLRVKPDNPGGMQIAGIGDELLSGTADGKVQAIAPGPERPNPTALRAQTAPAAPPVVTPVPSQAAAPPPVVAAPAPSPGPTKLASIAKPEPATTKPHAAAVPTASAPHAAAGAAPQVQLGSLASQQAAHDEWARLSRRMPDLLASRHPEVAKAEVNGRTYWRLRTAGFADASQAHSFCEQVRAKGGDCSVATF